MDSSTIIDTVRQVLADITHNEAVKTMDIDSSLKEGLGLDSMTSLTFLMALEDNITGFVVDADTLEAEHFTSIRTICEYVVMQVEQSNVSV